MSFVAPLRQPRNRSSDSGTARRDVPRIQTYKKKMFSAKPYKFIKLEGTTDPVPRPRSGHRTVTDHNGCIYSFGGYNPQPDPFDLLNDVDVNPLFQELWKYNPYLKLWAKLSTSGDAPVHLASHCTVMINGTLVNYGGTGVPFGSNSSNKVHICNTKSLNWIHVTPQNAASEANRIPLEQYGQAICADPVNAAIYVVGGTTGFQYTIDIHKFDLKTKTWTDIYRKVYQGTSFPEERYRHEVALYNNRIYIIGGGTATECYKFQIIPVFNLDTMSWQQLVSKKDKAFESNNQTDLGFPVPRRCHGMVHDDNNVYIVGGTDGKKIFNDVWRLDLDAMQWTRLPANLPKPVYFHSASLSPSGQLIVFGGVDRYDPNPHANARTNEMYSMWVGVPKLKEMAFAAHMHNAKNRKILTSLSRQQLVSMGIPHDFVDRIHDRDLPLSSGNSLQPNQPPPPF